MKRKITLFGSTFALVGTLIAIATSSAYPSASTGSKAARLGAASSSLGRIVVDGKRHTLYLFERDKGRRSTCYGACAAYWPPALTHGKPKARVGLKQSLIGTTRRRNGTVQVTYAGHPLYRYAGDSGPGQTTGAGLQDFGGGWDPVSPAGKKVESGG
jgi:predicted lipoprotein with Yx(FWY)xxD motif